MIRILFAAALLFSVLTSSSAQAELLTFDLAWSGATFGNSATATGTVTIDDTLLPNPGNNLSNDPASLGITNLTITVSGASAGNGTFTEVDFSEIAFDSGNFGNAILDLTTELVGQPTGADPWGTPSGSGGEFSLFSVPGSDAPTATFFFEFTTAEGSGDRLALTNFTPSGSAPPVPTGLLTFDVAWSGAAFGNSATATGTITIDDTVLPNPSGSDLFGVPFAEVGITSFTITVSGANIGNGTFTEADFRGAVWNTGDFGNAMLDLTSELVGQPTGQDPWGTSLGSGGGDFNFFSVNGSGAPDGTDFFEFTTSEGTGDSLSLTNFTPTGSTAPVPTGLLTFELAWSGASIGNSATATGLITIDDTLLPNPGNILNNNLASLGIRNLTITVSGASAGNGTFTEADFFEAAFDSGDFGNAVLDLTTELVGQPTGVDPWGTPSGNGGEFSLFSVPGSDAPTATFFFEFTTAEGSGDTLLLTNFTPVIIPEPTLPGDINLDGVVNFLDISPFISAISFGNQAEADVNQDGSVDFLDIGPFIALLSS